MSSVAIPKTIGHIWVGPLHPPLAWMDTWKEKHPDWEYRVYDNDYLLGRRWRCQEQILTYYRRGRYEGVADLMRYEILFKHGGFLPPADSTCLRDCGELFDRPALYSVWENEVKRPGYLSPFYASIPGHPFLDIILDSRSSVRPWRLRRPWKSVGNRFLGRIFREMAPDNVIVLPSYTFNPAHFSKSDQYGGSGTVYAEQHWGTTTHSYRNVCEPRSRREMRDFNRYATAKLAERV